MYYFNLLSKMSCECELLQIFIRYLLDFSMKTCNHVSVHNHVFSLQCTPSLLFMVGNKLLLEHVFTKEESKLRVLALGGEMFISPRVFKKWFEHASARLKIFNIFGTSELSSWASIHEVTNDTLQAPLPVGLDGDWVPIGEALSETLIEVRDESGQCLSAGLGELFLGKNKIFNNLSITLIKTKNEGNIQCPLIQDSDRP